MSHSLKQDRRAPAGISSSESRARVSAPMPEAMQLQQAIGNRAAGRLLQRYGVIKAGDATYPAKKEYKRFGKDQDATNDDEFFHQPGRGERQLLQPRE